MVNNLVVDVFFTLLTYEIFSKRNTKLKEVQWFWKAAFSILVLLAGLVLNYFIGFHQVGLICSILSMTPWIVPDRQIESYMNRSDRKRIKK